MAREPRRPKSFERPRFPNTLFSRLDEPPPIFAEAVAGRVEVRAAAHGDTREVVEAVRIRPRGVGNPYWPLVVELVRGL